ncbi:MAG: UDP-N-acetylmuramoyl-L-alanine--D-glutamate ligase [Bacteroidetes bacterium]|nr:MAG: UDP-N-acetylmuramoyl-L-alanine--D-glutamate ligase [Bacteroidota bacterium]
MKSVIVLGAGESGTGAALLAQWLGYAVFVSDKNAIKPAFKAELEQHEIAYEEQQHSLDRILRADLVIKSPGIPERVEVLQAVRQAGIPVWGEIEFAWRHMPASARVVAITGSNGKTTTTGLIHHILKTGGVNAVLGGNIGKAFARVVLKDLEVPAASRVYVIEVSSFQLEDVVDFRPDIAVLLNITPDHLDRYEYSMELYAGAKFRIAENQNSTDVFIYNEDDPVIGVFMGKHVLHSQKVAVNHAQYRHGTISVGPGNSFDLHAGKLRGPHNAFNAACAVQVARMLGVVPERIQEALNTFSPPPHRMEVIATVQGVTYINDSKATNVDAVFYALQAMEQPTIWIVGGQDKGNDYTPLQPLVQEKVKAIVCLGVDNRPIRSAFDGAQKPIVETGSAAEAVLEASKMADTGDVVLLSPACASFDLFKNYEDRGEQFRVAVLALANTNTTKPSQLNA